MTVTTEPRPSQGDVVGRTRPRRGRLRREVISRDETARLSASIITVDFGDDDVCYYFCWRLKLEGETENMGVCTKERKGVAAEVLMATPFWLSLID